MPSPGPTNPTRCGNSSEPEAGVRRMAVDVLVIRSAAASAAGSGHRGVLAHLRTRLAPRSLALARRQLAVMVGAGLPIVRSLHLLVEQAGVAPWRRPLHDVARRVEAGSPLGAAAAFHPDVSPPLYLSMVRA